MKAMINHYIIAAIGGWNKEEFCRNERLVEGLWHFVSTVDELDEILLTIKPKYIFFLHWRWIVPESILKSNKCICFHMTDLPYGRGGSPLQNLIVRGYKETVLTALRMEGKLDSGPVYFKEKLSLVGTAQEIYLRASKLSWNMISKFISQSPTASPQVGSVTLFKRRKPEESLIPSDLDLEQLFDYIRMLDAPGYPKAFIENENYRIEFEKSEFEGDELIASAKIMVRSKK